MTSNMISMRPGESLSQLEVRCIAEIEPKRACWQPVEPDSRVPLCTEHRSDPNIVVSARLARYARAVREWRKEDWLGQGGLPWE